MKSLQQFKNIFIIIIDFLAILANKILIITKKLFGWFILFFINVFLITIIYPETFTDIIKMISFVFQNYGFSIVLFFVFIVICHFILEIKNKIKKMFKV